ncbi:hypothetical protein B0H11DRAFT_201579 [Mycena galericulata]|nr:hypothetical protein B0H11DRAFT_201579 [Mycena galericulata]
MFSFTAHIVYHNSATCQVDRLETSVKKIEEVFDMAVNECTRDPRFVYEAGLKLTETKYVVSSLRTRTIDAKGIAWKKYPHHLRGLALSIKECRRDLEDLRASISLALESARRQKFKEDYGQRKATIDQSFPDDANQGFTRMRRPVAANGELYWSV